MKRTHTLVQRHKGRGIKTWYIRTCINGKENFKSTGTTNKTEAMKIFAKVVSSANNQSTTLSDIIINDEADAWLKSKEGVGKAITLYQYRSHMKSFKAFCDSFGLKTLADITTITAQNFVDRLKGSGQSAKTIREKVVFMRNMFKFSINRHDVIAKNPFSLVEMPKQVVSMVEFWTMEECDRIISKAPSKYWAAFWGLMAFAGLRFFESRKVVAEDINDGLLTIRQGKMGKDAVVPISNKLQGLLEPILDDRPKGSLFDGEIPKVSKNCVVHLRRAIKEAGVEEGGGRLNHKFRHSFASELLRKGASIRSTQTLGRWANPQILLKHYAGVMPKDLVEAVNIL